MISYEIDTEKVSLSELGKNISPVVMKNKISSNYRPLFQETVTEKMKTLISITWNESKEERPSFRTILSLTSKTDLKDTKLVSI